LSESPPLKNSWKTNQETHGKLFKKHMKNC